MDTFPTKEQSDIEQHASQPTNLLRVRKKNLKHNPIPMSPHNIGPNGIVVMVDEQIVGGPLQVFYDDTHYYIRLKNHVGPHSSARVLQNGVHLEGVEPVEPVELKNVVQGSMTDRKLQVRSSLQTTRRRRRTKRGRIEN
jgi:hypothetical protein